MKDSFTSVVNPDNPALKTAIDYIANKQPPFNLTSEFDRDSIVDGLTTYINNNTARLMELYYNDINESKDVEGLGTPLLYIQYVVTLELLKARNRTMPSFYAAIKICEYTLDGLFFFRADDTVSALGFANEQPVFNRENVSDLKSLIEKLYFAMDASDIKLKQLKDVPDNNKPVHASLKYFLSKSLELSTTGPTAAWLSDPVNFESLKVAFIEQPSDLDTSLMGNKAIDIERITFSGDLVKIL